MIALPTQAWMEEKDDPLLQDVTEGEKVEIVSSCNIEQQFENGTKDSSMIDPLTCHDFTAVFLYFYWPWRHTLWEWVYLLALYDGYLVTIKYKPQSTVKSKLGH